MSNKQKEKLIKSGLFPIEHINKVDDDLSNYLDRLKKESEENKKEFFVVIEGFSKIELRKIFIISDSLYVQ